MGFTLHPLKVHNASMNMVDAANQMNRNCLIKGAAKSGSNVLAAVTGVAAGIFETGKLVLSVPTTLVAVPAVWTARKVTRDYFNKPKAAYEALPGFKDLGTTAKNVGKQFAGVFLSLGGAFVVGSNYNVQKQHQFGNAKIERIVREADEARMEAIRQGEIDKISKLKKMYDTNVDGPKFDNKILSTASWKATNANKAAEVAREKNDWELPYQACDKLDNKLNEKNKLALKDRYNQDKAPFKYREALYLSKMESTLIPTQDEHILDVLHLDRSKSNRVSKASPLSDTEIDAILSKKPEVVPVVVPVVVPEQEPNVLQKAGARIAQLFRQLTATDATDDILSAAVGKSRKELAQTQRIADKVSG